MAISDDNVVINNLFSGKEGGRGERSYTQLSFLCRESIEAHARGINAAGLCKREFDSVTFDLRQFLVTTRARALGGLG